MSGCATATCNGKRWSNSTSCMRHHPFSNAIRNGVPVKDRGKTMLNGVCVDEKRVSMAIRQGETWKMSYPCKLDLRCVWHSSAYHRCRPCHDTLCNVHVTEIAACTACNAKAAKTHCSIHRNVKLWCRPCWLAACKKFAPSCAATKPLKRVRILCKSHQLQTTRTCRECRKRVGRPCPVHRAQIAVCKYCTV